MGYGTGGSFAADARSIGMNAHDIQQLTLSLSPKGNTGKVPYEWKGTKYQVGYEKDGQDITFTSIKPLR